MKPHDKYAVRTAKSEQCSYRHRPIHELEVDIEKYQKPLDNSGLDAKQRADFLAALLSIIIAFIDLGYRVHPVQKAIDGMPIGEDTNRAIIRAVDAYWRDAA